MFVIADKNMRFNFSWTSLASGLESHFFNCLVVSCQFLELSAVKMSAETQKNKTKKQVSYRNYFVLLSLSANQRTHAAL